MSDQQSEPSTNPYTAPASVFRDDVLLPQNVGVTPKSIEMLRQTRPWVLLMGILGLIGSVFILVGSAVLLIGFTHNESGVAGVGTLFLIYFVMGFAYVVGAVLLIRYALRISSLVREGTVEHLERALEAQKSFWRFVGIMMTVIIVLYVTFLVLALLFGLAWTRS